MSVAVSQQPATVLAADAETWRPSVLRLGWSRARLELTQLSRSRESLIFSIAFPTLMLTVFGSIASYDTVDGMPFEQYFAPCALAAAIFAAGFQSLAIQLAMERDKGVHRRLAVTPLPLLSYLIGKVVLVATFAVSTSVVLGVVAVLGYGVALPATAGGWATGISAAVLGLTACTLLGIAFSRLPRTARAAPALVTPVALLTQVFSGVFIPLSELPGWLHQFAWSSPLTWLVIGLRQGFGSTDGPASGWVLLVLTGWIVAGLALCKWTFGWGSNKP